MKFLSGAIIACLAVTEPIYAQTSILVSQLRSNYTAGGTTQSFQWYTYDINGQLAYRSAYDGDDTLSSLSSVVRYTYNGEGRLIGEATVVLGDTLYEFLYTYNGTGELIEVRRLNALGNTTYIDSLAYDTNSRLIRTQRWDNTGTILRYFHNLLRDGNGYVVSDTLYEPDSEGLLFIPKQATLFTNAPDGRIVSEDLWVEQSGWSRVSRTVLAYDISDRLTSRATYEGNGASGNLLDSLAYANDSYGNRILELHYDDERTLTYRIDSVWDIPTAVAYRASNSGRAAFSNGPRGSAKFQTSLYGVNGRLLTRPRNGAPEGALSMAVRVTRDGTTYASAVVLQ